MTLSERTCVTDALVRRLGINGFAKQLINLMSLNNVFVFKLCVTANLRVLRLMNGCASQGLDFLSSVRSEGAKKSQKAQILSKSMFEVARGHLGRLFNRVEKLD